MGSIYVGVEVGRRSATACTCRLIIRVAQVGEAIAVMCDVRRSCCAVRCLTSLQRCSAT